MSVLMMSNGRRQTVILVQVPNIFRFAKEHPVVIDSLQKSFYGLLWNDVKRGVMEG